MPAATSTKRVKNKRIERPFIIGSEAWPLDASNRKPDTPDDHTKGWRVYVKTPEGQPDISAWLKKVIFKIFHTYPNPSRTVESPPFEIYETGWGGFQVEIRLFFAPEVGCKPEWRMHFLQLEPYGDEALQQKQQEEKLVRSEFLEYIEFNEPTEALFDALTDDSQFGVKRGGPGSRGGKGGKGKAALGRKGADGNGEGTVELPDVPSMTTGGKNPFSKELETQILEMLTKAEQEVENHLGSEKERHEQTLKELEMLKKEAEPSS